MKPTSEPDSSSWRSPLTQTQFGSERPFWIVDGEPYDFSEWATRHPGGEAWFRWTQGRDISALFYTYHADPSKLKKHLAPYRIESSTSLEVWPKMGLPPFLLAPGFDAAADLPQFDFSQEGSLLHTIQKKLKARFSRAQLQRWHLAFDAATGGFVLLHIGALIAMVMGFAPVVACVLLLVLTRTALAGAGHYYIHRKKPTRHPSGSRRQSNVGQALFDVNYVGTCLIGMDGHVLLHHPYLRSGADVKQTFFSGMLRLHPAFRFVGYTFHKLGVALLGIFIRGYEVNFLERDKQEIRWEFWSMRLWLLVELVVCIAAGLWIAWFVQFLLSLWVNTLLVVSSHDFEQDHDDQQLLDQLPEAMRHDWAAQQVCLSYDLQIIGNRWIDLFLSAGLSPHRVHHVLPYQGSGFANLVSEEVVREACEEHGIPWVSPKSFLTERLPKIIKHYFFSPAQRPEGSAPSEAGLLFESKECIGYIFEGWQGVGAV